jgi:hypothetical protein
MDVRTLFDKEFIYAYDLQGRDVTVTIRKVVAGTLVGKGGKSNKKPVLYFEGKEKGLGLNITNARIIASIYGSFKSEDWLGKRITLYPTTTQFGSETMDCIRVRPKKPGANVKDAPPDPPAPPVEEREPGADDDEGAVA